MINDINGPKLPLIIKKKKKKNRASRWRAIAYSRVSAIAYLRAHRNSKWVPPFLIHRAIACDSFKSLVKKVELCDNKKGPKILRFDFW